MRTSENIVINGIVKTGFDYDLQVWIKDFIILDCGHPKKMGKNCCNAHKYAGYDVRELIEMAREGWMK